MSSVTTNNVIFYDRTVKEHTLARAHVALDLPFMEEWQDYVMPKICKLWDRPESLHHVIATGVYAVEMLAWSQFEWTGISCECKCERMDKHHVHMIGYIYANKGVRQRFFKKLNDQFGYPVAKYSSKYHKCIALKNVQHIISAVIYITREQRIYKKTFDTLCKHSAFLPFGLTKFAKLVMAQQRASHWEYFYNTLSLAGYDAQVTQCKTLYDEYRTKRAANLKPRTSALKRPMPRESQCDITGFSERTGIIRPAKIPCRTELSESDKDTMSLIQDDPILGTSLCDTDTARRIICFLRLHPKEIVGGLRDFVINKGPKEEDSMLSGSQ